MAFGTPSNFVNAGWPWYNSRSSNIVRFVQDGVVKTFRWATYRMSDRKRFPLSADGPFYVLDKCCVACEVPLTEAPDLMAMHQSADPDEFRYHCYFKRQPKTDAELQRAINAMHVQDLGCIRYGGSDSSVLSRLTSLELHEDCDELEPKRDG